MPKSLTLSALLLFSVGCMSASAQTNFGSVAVNDHTTMDVTVTVPVASSFTSINAVVLGATLFSDFGKIDGGTCATGVNYTAGQSCTVKVIFTPRYAGLRMGAVILHSSATNAFAITYIEGTGTGKSIAFNPSTAYAISALGASNTIGVFPYYPATNLVNPQYPAYDGNQNLYVFDPTIATGAIVKIPEQGSANTSTLIPRGVNGESVGATVKAIVVDGAGNRIIVGQNIAISMPQGSNTGQVYRDSYAGPASGASFTAAAVDSAGDLFLLDAAYGDIIEFPGGDSQATPMHYPLMVDGEPLMNPGGLAVDGMGNIYVSDTGNNRVVEYPAGGGTPTLIAPTVHGKTLNAPAGLAVDGIGSLYICDTLNHRVVEIPAGGSPAFEIIPTVNNIPLGAPKGITAVAGGYLYIADPDNARVVQVMGSMNPTLTFAPTPVGTTSPDSPQTVKVQNSGTDSFNFTGVSFPTDFPAGSSANACTSSTVLDAGQTCDLNITFKPQSAGVLKETVQLSTDTPYVYDHPITVSGTGTNIQLSTNSLAFGSVGVGSSSASQQVTLTNTGTTPIQILGAHVTGPNASAFIFDSNCYASLGAGQSCSVHGHFSPTVVGPATATLTITNTGANAPQTVMLSGTGISAATATLSSTSISFGFALVGFSGPSQQVTLTNTGADALRISGIKVTGANASSFVIGYDCPGSLPGGSSCTIHGHFAPTTTGPLTAAITITDSAGGSPQMITLTGTGQ